LFGQKIHLATAGKRLITKEKSRIGDKDPQLIEKVDTRSHSAVPIRQLIILKATGAISERRLVQ
jgi:hypothetical protein